MHKRFLALSLAFFAGWLLWDVLHRQAGQHTADFAAHDVWTTLGTMPNEALPPDIIEQAIETPPHVAPVDMVELAFVAAAVGVDLTPDEHAPANAIEGYCVRCKAHRSIVDPQFEAAKNGRPMARGTCSICGARMVRFLKEDEVPDAQ